MDHHWGQVNLRHEAASRFEEAGVPISQVSRLLGHTNLTTTSRYLNVHRRELHRAMEQFEAAQNTKSDRTIGKNWQVGQETAPGDPSKA
ncbi:MAG: hypothetical protein CL476_13245 [Acidobacteria bacterium]|nr:hypothetical protein [Acidobacteriota bacterium]